MNILLDTNFLIYLIKHRIVDKLDELKPHFILPIQVFDELKKISKNGRGNNKQHASLSLTLIENWKKENKVEIDSSEKGYADDAVLKIAQSKKDRIYVATLDKALTTKLKKAKIGILKIRQKKYLMFE